MRLPAEAHGRRLTIDEYLRLPDDGWRTELVRGRVIREPQPGFRHGEIQTRLAFLLLEHIREHRLELACVGPVGVIVDCANSTVRGPDLAVISRSRLPSPEHEGFLEDPPELVVEIVSPTNRGSGVTKKVREYLGAGVPVIWVVDPDARAVTVHRDGSQRVVEGSDALDAADLLPGLMIRTEELFGPPPR